MIIKQLERTFSCNHTLFVLNSPWQQVELCIYLHWHLIVFRFSGSVVFVFFSLLRFVRYITVFIASPHILFGQFASEIIDLALSIVLFIRSVTPFYLCVVWSSCFHYNTTFFQIYLNSTLMYYRLNYHSSTLKFYSQNDL